jgi:hypothetical protein
MDIRETMVTTEVTLRPGYGTYRAHQGLRLSRYISVDVNTDERTISCMLSQDCDRHILAKKDAKHVGNMYCWILLALP